MTILNNNALLGLIERSIVDSGWNCLVVNDSKPFRLRVYHEDGRRFETEIYIWNCTHGGGSKRASDEYRIQITGVVPQEIIGIKTALLGWHDEYNVFAGFDIVWHRNQSSQSPSIQIKEETLRGAHWKSFSISRRQNGELAVAFKPEFLVEYLLNSRDLHRSEMSAADIWSLNNLSNVNIDELSATPKNQREVVISTIARKYRAADFRYRVTNAYRNQCAFCGIQLKLIDAAHIIPVVSDSSTDETCNGIALCKIHHSAYDRNLVSFDENYRIEMNPVEQSHLAKENLVGGWDYFKDGLKKQIILPENPGEYPSVKYISASRKIRNWPL